ncbi:serine protease grass-like isoform X2 [Drosophila albomicans]|uniref:CLIP domain-containing serine protease n=1 Tax=Drosophila albomicans TaxID=7291 RepID=A0A6P8XTZ7_DROAB|nr:serine protease grass-like isoform X2 [Drosophila albomicans]
MQLFTGIFAVLLLAFPSLVLTESDISCYTPTGEEGICISAKQCPFVIDLLKQYNDKVPRIIQNQIRELACDGEEGVRFAICCPNTPKVILEEHVEPQSLSFIDPKGMEILDSVTPCGQRIPGAESLIVGSYGELTRKGEFPWMVLLKYETSGRPFLCGGSLITNRFVLTAAHCTTAPANIIGVRLGEHNLDTDNDCSTWLGYKTDCLPPYEEFGIEDIRPHPKFERHTNSYDIALIKLNQSVTFKPHIRPICLPIDKESKDIAFDQSFYIAGWGTTEKGMASHILLKAVVERQHLDVCRKYYNNATFTENHICAVNDRKQETCRGDSGGPLFFLNHFNKTISFVQYGVISFGGQSCGINENQPGVFASVLDMLPWITQNLY